jgi:hypothetical protein
MCDIGKKQFLLEYKGEPAKARCMDIMVDPEFQHNLADSNIVSAVGYAVEELRKGVKSAFSL